MVSWVPGSPIDCAAMMPTASPMRDRLTVGQVCAVALGADALLGLAVEDGADLDLGDASVHNLLRASFSSIILSLVDQHLAGLWIDKVVCQVASDQTLGQASR